MKKLKLMALAILISGTSIYAYEHLESDPVIPLPLLKAQIVELLPKGFFGTLEEGTVDIHFTYGSSGEIIVLRIGSENKWVKKYIRKNLNQKKVDVPGEIGRVYHIRLKIESEK